MPDFSVLGLATHAAAMHVVVEVVLYLLVVTSLVCFAIILFKVAQVWKLSREIRQLQEAETKPLGAVSARGLTHTLLKAAEQEANEDSARGEPRLEFRARLERAMRGALKARLQQVEDGWPLKVLGPPFLATVGSAAPFIGLFGTVLGIVNSFTSIAQQKDTSLAVVAPGIAEALIATAAGLFAAIPAVVAYNLIVVSLGRASALANSSITEIAKRMAREQDGVAAGATPMRPRKAL